MTDVFKLPVFGPADVFPMMFDDELAELAADIELNGLREPLVVAEIPDDEGELYTMLVDGRNRRAACKIAGVKDPPLRVLNGEDPAAFVVSANIHRRHMTKGQQAMAVAMIYPEPEKGGRGRKGKASETDGFSSTRLKQARTVLAQGPEDLAPAVLKGRQGLDVAYEIARRRKSEADDEDKQLNDLRARYPDLADKVVEGDIGLRAALVEADERDERLRQQQATAIQTVADAIHNLKPNGGAAPFCGIAVPPACGARLGHQGERSPASDRCGQHRGEDD